MVLDEVWMIVLPRNKGVVYDTMASSAHEAWQKAFAIEGFLTEETMKKSGYRARKVKILFD